MTDPYLDPRRLGIKRASFAGFDVDPAEVNPKPVEAPHPRHPPLGGRGGCRATLRASARM